MTLEQIHQEFAKLLDTGKQSLELRRKIGMPSYLAAAYRYYIKQGQLITTEKKLQWLQKAGITSIDTPQFTRQDLVRLVNFQNSRVGKNTLKLGPEYVVEKFLQVKDNWHGQY